MSIDTKELTTKAPLDREDWRLIQVALINYRRKLMKKGPGWYEGSAGPEDVENVLEKLPRL